MQRRLRCSSMDYRWARQCFGWSTRFRRRSSRVRAGLPRAGRNFNNDHKSNCWLDKTLERLIPNIDINQYSFLSMKDIVMDVWLQNDVLRQIKIAILNKMMLNITIINMNIFHTIIFTYRNTNHLLQRLMTITHIERKYSHLSLQKS